MSLLLVPRDLEGLAERQPARAKDGGIYLLGRRKTALYLQCHKNMLLREEICTEAARGSRLETPQFSQHRTHLPVLFLKRLHTHTVRVVETVVIWQPPPPPFPLIRGPPLLEPLVFLSWTHSKTFQPHSDIHFGVLLHHRHLLSQGFLPAAGLTACQPCFTALASSGYLLLKKKKLLS